eukprot:gene16707-22973_t
MRLIQLQQDGKRVAPYLEDLIEPGGGLGMPQAQRIGAKRFNGGTAA